MEEVEEGWRRLQIGRSFKNCAPRQLIFWSCIGFLRDEDKCVREPEGR
jgi:hypothetical protein